MTFKELKSGYPVYLLDRTALRYEQGKVMAVGAPHADMQIGNYGKMLVDITIQTDGKQNIYSVADTEQTAYAGSLLIATSKDFVVNEVRAINTQAEETLAKVGDAQKTVAACKALLEELDTAYKEKRETEQRFREINDRFCGVEEKMDRILKVISEK